MKARVRAVLDEMGRCFGERVAARAQKRAAQNKKNREYARQRKSAPVVTLPVRSPIYRKKQ